MFRKERVYLDYAAATPIDPRIQKVIKDSQKLYANPSAIHQEGVLAKKSLEEARGIIAKLAQVKPKEVIFTASGTESDNLAIQGVFFGYQGQDLPHIITSTIEHPAILAICRKLEKTAKAEISYVGVNEAGLINPDDVRRNLKKNTILVSIMQVNNEVGTIQPISKIAKIIKGYRKENGSQYPYFHTDASQGACYLDFRLESLGVDLLTLDSIKTYGPRGVGVLIKKDCVKASPVLLGGGQEGGLRPGSENLPGLRGFQEALSIACREREFETKRLEKIRDYGIEEIQKVFPKATLNGSRETRLPNNINVCFPGVDAEFLVIKLDNQGVAVSFSSSCRSLTGESSSYVVNELGKKDCATSSIRITLGRFSTKKDIDRLVSELKLIFENN